MLKFFIEIIIYLTVFAVLAGLILSYLEKTKSIFLNILVSVISLIGLSSTIVMIILKEKFPQKMVHISLFYNRLFLSLGMGFIIISFILIAISILKKRDVFFVKIYSITSTISFWFVGITIFPQVYALTKEFIAFGETSFGTQSLIRLAGFSLGFLLIIILGLATYKLSIKINESKRNLLNIILNSVILIDFASRGIAALARLRILKARNRIVFKIMIFEDRSLVYIITLFTIFILIFAIYFYSKNIKIIGEFKNNAFKRIEKAKIKNNRYWAITLSLSIILVFLTVTALRSYVNKPVELSPPKPYQMEGNNIVIPLSDVDDGHLHRFSYISSGGNNVRFIVVKKVRGGSYGIGLDACDICGVAGYYERNDEVVCKRCDVVMNKATIGFRGGCNPVPFEFVIKDKKIIIDVAVLEKESYRFPVGE